MSILLSHIIYTIQLHIKQENILGQGKLILQNMFQT